MYKLFNIDEVIEGNFPGSEIFVNTPDRAFYQCIYEIQNDKPIRLIGEDRILCRDLRSVLAELNRLSDKKDDLGFELESKINNYERDLQELRETVSRLESEKRDD